MTNERRKALYKNLLDYIGEAVGGCDLIETLRAIGFTDKEIWEEFPAEYNDEKGGSEA